MEKGIKFALKIKNKHEMDKTMKLSFVCGVLATFLTCVYLKDSCPGNCMNTCRFSQNGSLLEAKCFNIVIQSFPVSIVKLEVQDATDWKVLPFGVFKNDTLYEKSQLQMLTINNYKIHTLEGQCFKMCPNLHILDLSKNDITGLKSENFVGLANLQDLNLNQNKLQTIGNYTFEHLTSLVGLHLVNQTNIVSLRKYDFAGLVKLETLDLQFNQISTIHPQSFSGLASIKAISLNHNRLTTIQAGTFAGLANLRSINLLGNHIHLIDPASMTGTRLTLLQLSQNELADIPTTLLQQVSNADLTVNMARNSVTDITAGAFNGVVLGTLYLVANQITHIDEDALINSHIQVLDLQQNLLKHIPEGLARSLDQSNGLLLANNMWSCDCDIQWVRGLLINSTNQEPTCAEPLKYFGQKLIDAITDMEVTCSDTNVSLPVPPTYSYQTPKLDHVKKSEPHNGSMTTQPFIVQPSSQVDNHSISAGIIAGATVGVLVLAIVVLVVVKMFLGKPKIEPDPVFVVIRKDVNFKPFMKYTPQDCGQMVDV